MNALSKISIAISDLTVEERLELIEALWDSLEDADLTPAQEAELDRRIKNIDAGNGDALGWDVFRTELRARYF